MVGPNIERLQRQYQRLGPATDTNSMRTPYEGAEFLLESRYFLAEDVSTALECAPDGLIYRALLCAIGGPGVGLWNKCLKHSGSSCRGRTLVFAGVPQSKRPQAASRLFAGKACHRRNSRRYRCACVRLE